MKRLCVYTCITGDYDDLHEIEQPENGVDYLCFTNNKKFRSKTWQIIQIKNNGLDDHYLSRKIKMLGHPIIDKKYDVSVWMDASVTWQKPVSDFVKTFLKDAPMACFKHSLRDTARKEAEACLLYNKDTKENLIKTLSFLESEKFQDNLGLYEMTVFIKKHGNPIVAETMNLWFETLKKYSKRDQISFVYAVWKTGLKINPINLNVWDNPWFYTSSHNVIKDIDVCHVYYGDLTNDFDFNNFYTYKYHKNNQTYKINDIIPKDTSKITIIPTRLVGVEYKNINVRPLPDKIEIIGGISYNQKNIFCSRHNLIELHGKFKKGQKFFMSIALDTQNNIFLSSLIEYLWHQNNNLLLVNESIAKENKILVNDNNTLHNQILKINSSKTLRFLRFIKKILPFR